MSSLQPHGLTDYLRSRDIGLEVGSIVLGALAFAGGVWAVLLSGRAPGAGWLALVLGTLVAGVSITALVLQRSMLRSPLRADDEDLLVVNDIVLAIGLRDLMGAAGAAAVFSVVIVTTWLQWPLWEVGLTTAGTGALLRLLFDPRPRPEHTPVAQRLAGSPFQ